MALLIMDGFDDYLTTIDADAKTEIARLWTVSGAGTATIKAGLDAGQAVLLDNLAISHVANSSATKLILGLCVKALAQSGPVLKIMFDPGTNVSYLELLYDGTGTLSLAGISVAFDAGPITSWRHFEVVIVTDGSAASTLAVNEVQIAATTTNVTLQANVEIIAAAGCQIAIDHLYVLDQAGTTCNAPLGLAARIYPLTPSADTAVEDWVTVGTADAYDVLNNVPPVPAEYVKATTDNDALLVALSNLPVTPDRVLAVAVKTLALNVDGGNMHDLALLMDHTGTPTVIGATTQPATTPTAQRQQFELNPETTAAWTVAEVNALQLGLKMVP